MMRGEMEIASQTAPRATQRQGREEIRRPPVQARTAPWRLADPPEGLMDDVLQAALVDVLLNRG